MEPSCLQPTLWTVSASDSGGGAGLQADNRMAGALSVVSANIVSALTAQNSTGVQAIYPVTVDFLERQWQALQADGWPQAIKIGWLPEQESVLSWLVGKLQQARLAQPQIGIIWDPVLRATQGGLPHPRWHPRTLQQLLALCDVITPNHHEVQQLLVLLQLPVATELSQQVNALLSSGVGCVVVTGGDVHADADWVNDCVAVAVDRWPQQPETQALTRYRLRRRRLPHSCHGSGCHFSTAIAAYWAQGKRLYDALLLANAVMGQVLQTPWLHHSGYHNARLVEAQPPTSDDIPMVEPWPNALPALTFANAEALGLYAIVDSLPQLEHLLQLGVDTLQWRVKRPAFDESELVTAIDRCRSAGVPLYINDHWQLAITHRAYGVHLGQEDLALADLERIAAAGLRLGISTHTEWEIARARSLNPSYIAVGPVHHPLSKTILYPPLGYDQLQQWHQRYRHERPMTCIGGIVPENVASVSATGMDSFAIVTALRVDDGLAQRHAQLRQYCAKHLKSKPLVPTS